ncbi:hypothetical protein B0T19DRAFT_400910 [Cercophora scortea]|uniref:Uncharacterized protein n=1 Tax=Cercophora scortea TaxID=314031 RepID=A0AAE0IMX9_9PEZI|nr:hypothetical protein B0T19DRAFT_400910 [Cercophora scortea]
MASQMPPEHYMEQDCCPDVNIPLLGGTSTATCDPGKIKRGIWGKIWDALQGPSRPSSSSSDGADDSANVRSPTSPMHDIRKVHTRTISFEYDCTAGQLKIRTPHRSRRRAAARVDVCLCSKDLEWLQGLDRSVITDPSKFVRTSTGVIAVGFTWMDHEFLREHHGDTPVRGLFDFIWFGQWAPDFSSWLLDWHNIPRRPNPIPGDHAAVFLDIHNHGLQLGALSQMQLHLGHDPKKHSNTIYPLWPAMFELPGPDIDRGFCIRITAPGHGNYAITCQQDTTLIVPRWERMTKEENDALFDAMENPGKNRDGAAEDARSWPSTIAWYGLGNV